LADGEELPIARGAYNLDNLDDIDAFGGGGFGGAQPPPKKKAPPKVVPKQKEEEKVPLGDDDFNNDDGAFGKPKPPPLKPKAKPELKNKPSTTAAVGKPKGAAGAQN
jgi:hypothetical protein